jgi:hypothetical protein
LWRKGRRNGGIQYRRIQLPQVTEHQIPLNSRKWAAVVPQGVVASESFVNSEVASEAALRISGDESTLSSAQSYTDAEVLEEKGLREAEDLLMFKKDGSRTMTGKMNMGSFKIEGLANGVESGEAINKGQLDALELHVEGQISSLQTDLEGQI